MDKELQAKSDAAAQQKLASMFAASKEEITIPKIYVDMTGDIKAAAVLDELMFWTLPKRGKTSLRVFKNGGLWLAVRRSDWWDRKRLTERQSDGAIEKLIGLDLVEKDVFLFDGKPTVHIRIKTSNFVKLFAEKMQEASEEDPDLKRDISDLYEMMGFPNEMVISNSPNGEMLNSPNGEIINSLQQPPNTAIGEKEKKEILSKSDPAWSVLAGEDIQQEQIDRNVLTMDACNAFEQALNFLPLEWDLNKEWGSLKRFVVEQYEKDPSVFRKYAEWRAGKGQYKGAMNNKNILDKPARFISLFPDFMAQAMLGKPKSASITKDSNDIPMSYS